MDPLGQILNAHITIEVGIFRVEIRQHVLHPQIEIVRALKLHQPAQEPHRPGFVDADTEQKQQVVGAGFLHHYAALVEELSHQRRRDPLIAHNAVLVHPRRQNGDLHRIEEHMILIGIAEAVPALAGGDRPAFGFIDLFRLPDIEEPVFGLIFQPLHLFAEVQRPLHRAVNQPLARIPPQHGGRGFDGGNQRIARRGGSVHHKGFVKGLFVIVAFNVNERCLGERRQHFVGGLGFIKHFAGHPLAAHTALAGIDRMEVGIGYPGGVKVDRGDIQRLLHPVGVIQQPVIGGVGDHRMYRPAGLRHLGHFALDGRMGKFTARNAAQDPQRVARRRKPERHHVAHHQQMGEGFMAVAIDKQRAARRRRVHADDFVGGGGAVGHHVALLGAKGAGDILFRLQVRTGVIQQRPQLGDRDRHIRLQRIAAEEIIKQAADRAFLIRGPRHMARGAEGVFALFNVGEERAGKRRRDVIKVFAGILLNAGGNVFGHPQRVFKKPQRHAHILGADIHRRMGIDKGIERQIFVELIDLAAQLQIVLVPVEDHAADPRVVFDKLQ